MNKRKRAPKVRMIPPAAAGASKVLTRDSAAPFPGQSGATGDGAGANGAGLTGDSGRATRAIPVTEIGLMMTKSGMLIRGPDRPRWVSADEDLM